MCQLSQRPKGPPAPARPAAPPPQTAHAGTAHAGDRSTRCSRASASAAGSSGCTASASDCHRCAVHATASSRVSSSWCWHRSDAPRRSRCWRRWWWSRRRSWWTSRQEGQARSRSGSGDRRTSRKTMASMRGPTRRGGARRADDGTYREEMAAQRCRRGGAREEDGSRQRVHHRQRARADPQDLRRRRSSAFAFKNLGLMVTINQRLDFDQIELIAGEFGFQAVREEEYAGRRQASADRRRHAEELVSASARRHDHGSRRPRQDVAARLHPQGERRRRRGGRHHAAHRRVPRRAAERQDRSRSSTRRATRRSPPCAHAARR